MILRPEQVRLLRMGRSVGMANGEGGSSSSSSDQNTNMTDRSIITESGIVATEGSTINATVQRIDGDIVNKALDTVSSVNAINGQGFSKLLDLAGNFVTKTQDTASGMAARYQTDVLDAYSRAQADKSGGFDQRTIVVLGVTAAAALVMMNRKG